MHRHYHRNWMRMRRNSLVQGLAENATGAPGRKKILGVWVLVKSLPGKEKP
jgi:hypothetical protein